MIEENVLRASRASRHVPQGALSARTFRDSPKAPQSNIFTSSVVSSRTTTNIAKFKQAAVPLPVVGSGLLGGGSGVARGWLGGGSGEARGGSGVARGWLGVGWLGGGSGEARGWLAGDGSGVARGWLGGWFWCWRGCSRDKGMVLMFVGSNGLVWVVFLLKPPGWQPRFGFQGF